MRIKNYYLVFAVAIAIFSACKSTSTNTENNEVNKALQDSVQTYLDAYNKTYQQLYIASSDAAWAVNTHIVEGDSTNALAARKADEAMAAFTGSKENIETARKYLAKKEALYGVQVKQLETILYAAANNPATLKDVVSQRIKAETAQTEKLFGYTFKLNGKKVSTNEIDEILAKETDVKKRQAAWESSKEVGKELKDGLANLRDLRNKTVQGLGYPDYFNYQVSDYNMTTQEMLDMNKKFIKEVWPLYRELHTYARYELAKKYKEKNVPDMLPAHWVSNRWAQDWSAMVSVEGINLDSILGKKSPEWIVQKGEEFYVSLGFPALPKSFYEKSSLYPLPKDAKYSKNNHASAWHMDLENDVRSLMSVTANEEWYATVNHELGHIYYYLTYTNKDVPPLLRGGANRAYHEAFGTMIGMAALQKPFLAQHGLLPANVKTDEMQQLLKDALQYIVFIPFSAGVMTEFEHSLYAENLPKDQYNKKWWELVQKYQGVTPPSTRGEQYCDAASKTHINDDAAQYYDYAMSFILLFQIHDHISKNILKQDPHNTNYYGNKEAGKFLKDIMYWGASKDWREVLKEKTGSELSAKPMLDYFAPLMDHLKQQNKGRKYTLPETI
ncbi:MAG: M2 family metallopeptidase [Bacteroidia bacterium]